MTNAFFFYKEEMEHEGAFVLGRPLRVLFGFCAPPPLSLILLSPEENRDGTEKGIQFWIERSIMNSSGNSVLGGLGFRRAEVFSKPKMGESGGGAQRGRGRTSHWTEVSGPPETGLWAKHMALIFEPPGLCPGR